MRFNCASVARLLWGGNQRTTPKGRFMAGEYYAHSLQGPDKQPLPQSEWEPLIDHLREVSDLASTFAAEIGAQEWGRLAGIWHDVGKYSDRFQAYLLTQNGFETHLEQHGRVNHSTAGARLAMQLSQAPDGDGRSLWRILAYVIAGHHAGLADATGGQSSLEGRLDPTRKIEAFQHAAPPEVLAPPQELPCPDLVFSRKDPARGAFQFSFFTRMLFSCLVDADFLQTEAFMNRAKSALRPSVENRFESMQRALDAELQRLAGRSSSGPGQSLVSQCRQEVLADCLRSADQEPGLFSLTVPTGGGKTLASLAFALKHARKHNLNRVIYAIPFTSIIEQSARVFREVFDPLGGDVVLEHHSNLDPERETPKSRLASENWDAPLVVTTNVQLFESLFAARTSRCRKLHNIVGSVIILDEAQTLPVELLRPCLEALRELVTDYRCSIVLCTATQPALERSEEFPIGLEDVHEIIRRPSELYRRMKRVELQQLGPIRDDELIARLSDEPSFLTIVNTRAHAATLCRRLAETCDGGDLFHLSTLMCGEHRQAVITQIRDRLENNQPCRVISTQLVEAGVDLDFPVVYRALSGIDSIAQAAGRCNREGRLERATVWVFEPTEVQLRGMLASMADSARQVMPDHEDLLSPEAVKNYFLEHYWKEGSDSSDEERHRWDHKQVMGCFLKPPERLAFNFRTAAERFRMIDEVSQPVFVQYQEQGKRLIKRLRAEGPSRDLLRGLQRYTVGIPDSIFRAHLGADFEPVLAHDGSETGFYFVSNEDLYDEQRFGLQLDRFGEHDPEGMIG
jgi:CRISPR-associated endonuclease/helicase Cas3